MTTSKKAFANNRVSPPGHNREKSVNTKIRSYRDLVVWQRGMTLVKYVYELSAVFPDEEKFGLTSQLRRASVSIPCNIAEGYGRNSTKDYVRFLNIACGSLYESQTLLELARNLKILEQRLFDTTYEQTREIERMLTSLIRKLST